VWSLHGRYLLTPTDGGLMMVDQRAAHVRILYERALDRLDDGSGESQQLLFPQTVDLDPADADLLDEWADELRALGFDLERMSGRTVAVRGVPADVRSDRETSILQDVLATLREEGRPSRSDRHQHLARSLAQQGAIPRGRTLAPPERRALLHDLMNCDMPYADPSGTPTILNLSMEEIEKRFRG
jgi:DNA mismatch repair protein MutL